MADKEFDDLTQGTLLDGTELAVVMQGANSRYTTAAELGHQLRGAKVYLTSDDTTVNTTAGHNVSWDAAVYDTNTFWSAGSPTRLTIPAGLGITHVDVEAHIRVDLTTGDTFFQTLIQHYNVSDVLQEQWGLSTEKGTSSTVFQQNFALGVPVSDGDYVVFRITEESDSSVTIESSVRQTSMTIRVVGMEPI